MPLPIFLGPKILKEKSTRQSGPGRSADYKFIILEKINTFGEMKRTSYDRISK